MTRRQEYELEGLLETLRIEGTILVRKEKLLALLGRERDRQGAWRELIEKFEEIGGSNSKLYGIEFSDQRILLSTDRLEPVSDWAGGSGV